MVGGWRTCVEAAHIRTSGLGGDLYGGAHKRYGGWGGFRPAPGDPVKFT